MNYSIDKHHLGITYTPKHLLNAYGLTNCYILDKELYAMTNINGEVVVSFFRLENMECIKIARPSKLARLCAAHESLWLHYQNQYEKHISTRREPTEYEREGTRKKQRQMPIPETAPKAYGKVLYLAHTLGKTT